MMHSIARSALSSAQRILSRRITGVVLVGSLLCVPAAARASETVDAKIGFSPFRLGHGTTVVSSIEVATTNGEVPSPAVEVELHFPRSLSFTSSTLGLETCEPTTLLAEGQDGCPRNARIGLGTAQVAVPFGPEVISETAEMIVYMGPSAKQGVTLLLYGEGHSPVYAQMLLQGALVGGDGPFNELLLKSDVPLIPTLPGARDVAITNMRLSLGPQNLRYVERVHGRTVSYRPRGILLPSVCPAGGFPFTSTISFQDGSVSKVNIVVPCPHGSARRARHAPRSRHG